MDAETVNPRQLDAVREVVNIGAGHAATALSSMTNLRVMISVPRIQFTSTREDAGGGAIPPGTPLVVIGVPVQGHGEAEGGKASLVLTRETALRMIGLLLRQPQEDHGSLDPMQRSTLMELGNIVCASYVGVLSSFRGEGVLIGTPELREAPAEEVAELTRGLLIETDFLFQDQTFEGVFVFAYSQESFGALMSTLGLANLT